MVLTNGFVVLGKNNKSEKDVEYVALYCTYDEDSFAGFLFNGNSLSGIAKTVIRGKFFRWKSGIIIFCLQTPSAVTLQQNLIHVGWSGRAVLPSTSLLSAVATQYSE